MKKVYVIRWASRIDGEAECGNFDVCLYIVRSISHNGKVVHVHKEWRGRIASMIENARDAFGKVMISKRSRVTKSIRENGVAGKDSLIELLTYSAFQNQDIETARNLWKEVA